MDGYILVYSITSRPSFEETKVLLTKLRNILGTDEIPITIVGNKKDSREDREVSAEEIRKFSELRNVYHMEISAKVHGDCVQLFEQMVGEVLLYREK